MTDNNRTIDSIFKSIEGIAETYLCFQYPEAPDPDMYMGQIEAQIKRYWSLMEDESCAK